jgi:membrane associated rhomboid family serine protease
MGYADRDYSRSVADGPRPRWTVVGILIVVNIVVYFFEAVAVRSGDMGFVDALSLRPRDVVERFHLWQLVTSVFLHHPLSVMHIAFNMLFLYWFGREIEILYGARRFLALYFGSGVLGSLCYVAGGYLEGRPDVPALGASGAVMGVVVVAAFHFPWRPIYLFFFIRMPLFLAVLLFVLSDLYHAVSGVQTGVATLAHLGGALCGFLFYKLRPPEQWFEPGRWLGGEARPSAPREDPALARDVDAILAKISREGMGSLTPAERATLERASEAKRRGS